MTKKTKLKIAKDALIDVYRSVTLPRLHEQGFFIPNAMGAFEGREQGVDYYPIARIGDGYRAPRFLTYFAIMKQVRQPVVGIGMG